MASRARREGLREVKRRREGGDDTTRHREREGGKERVGERVRRKADHVYSCVLVGYLQVKGLLRDFI